MKKLLIGLLVMVMGGVSYGVMAVDNFDSYTPGDINGQGGTDGDWAGPYAATISTSDPTFTWDVEGTGDQYLAAVGSISSGHKLDRAMDAWSGDFVLQLDAKISAASVATHQLQFLNASNQRPLNIKWDGGGAFKVNDLTLTNYLAPGGR